MESIRNNIIDLCDTISEDPMIPFAQSLIEQRIWALLIGLLDTKFWAWPNIMIPALDIYSNILSVCQPEWVTDDFRESIWKTLEKIVAMIPGIKNMELLESCICFVHNFLANQAAFREGSQIFEQELDFGDFGEARPLFFKLKTGVLEE